MREYNTVKEHELTWVRRSRRCCAKAQYYPVFEYKVRTIRALCIETFEVLRKTVAVTDQFYPLSRKTVKIYPTCPSSKF